MDERARAFFDRITGNLGDFPAGVTIQGREYHGFPDAEFHLSEAHETETEEKLERKRVLSGPGGFTVVLRVGFWKDYGVTEWTISYRNDGGEDTALLENARCCDMLFSGGEPLVRGILGDHENQYAPYARPVGEEPVSFVSLSGRPTHVYFPYFNLEHGDGGTMLAIGWAGTWSAAFSREGEDTRFIASSTVDLSLMLHPGEQIETALMVVAPYYVRDEAYATNFWRRWFVRCNMPRKDASGALAEPFSSCCLASDTGLPNTDGSISERSTTWRPTLEKMLELGARVDYRWFDAGWYCDPEGNTVPEDWWGTVGSWTLDPVKWPGDSFRQSVDFAHARGMRTLMWFEPERVSNPAALEKNFGYREKWAIRRPDSAAITNNIGDPECLAWITERICRTLRENRVDMYREDNNSDPGTLWRELDAREGRRGMTECRVVSAHYRLWDDILETTKSYGGNAFCDSCAGGGGRNDIASLRRGIPLLRSDADRTTTALRLSMTTSFNRWIPFCGANTKEKAHELDVDGRSDVYIWRASYLPSLNVDSRFVHGEEGDFGNLLFGLREWDTVKPYLLQDFYVHTPWHTKEDKRGFTAYSFFDPEEKKGVLLAFRMEECEEDCLRIHLPFARPDMSLRDADTGETLAAAEELVLHFPEKRTARLLYIG